MSGMEKTFPGRKKFFHLSQSQSTLRPPDIKPNYEVYVGGAIPVSNGFTDGRIIDHKPPPPTPDSIVHTSLLVGYWAPSYRVATLRIAVAEYSLYMGEFFLLG